MADTAVVPVKSAWYSKINYTALIGPVLSAFVVANPSDVIDLARQIVPVDLSDPQLKVALVLGIQLAQSSVTWVLRTWFNRTVTPA